MIISQRTFQLLLQLGAPADKLAEVLHALDEDAAMFTPPNDPALEARRASDRERQERRRRAKDGHVTSRDKRDSGDPLPPKDSTEHLSDRPSLTQNPYPTPPIVPPAPTVVAIGGGGSDWPDSDLVKALVAEVGSPRLDPAKSPGLITTAGRLAAWKREGASWEHDVLPVVKGLCAASRGPISTWKFFDTALGRSIADNRAALAIPEARSASAYHSQGPPSLTNRIGAENDESRRKALKLMENG